LSAFAEEITAYAQQKYLSVDTLARWQAWAQEDQAAFLRLAENLQLGENQMRDFLDWLEEVVVRDGGAIHEILARPEIRRPLDSRLSRNDRLKTVKNVLRKLRYPRLAHLEEELRVTVKALDLGGQVRVSFPPVLEGDEVTIELKVCNVRELAEIVHRLQQRLEDGALQRLFDMLDQV